VNASPVLAALVESVVVVLTVSCVPSASVCVRGAALLAALLPPAEEAPELESATSGCVLHAAVISTTAQRTTNHPFKRRIELLLQG
jgi:hypothetical protein